MAMERRWRSNVHGSSRSTGVYAFAARTAAPRRISIPSSSQMYWTVTSRSSQLRTLALHVTGEPAAGHPSTAGLVLFQM
jgi:hypothetical protein